MAHIAQWNNFQSVFAGIATVMVFIGGIATRTYQRIDRWNMACSPCNYNSRMSFYFIWIALAIVLGVNSLSFTYFWELLILQYFGFAFYALSITSYRGFRDNMSLRTDGITLSCGFIFMRILLPLYFAARFAQSIMFVFTGAVMMEFRYLLSNLAMATYFCYCCLRHVFLLIRKSRLGPIASTNLRSARFIIYIIFLLSIFSSNIYAANEVRAFCPGATTLYYTVREIDGDIFYPATNVFEVFGTGARTLADYDLILTSKGVGMFVGTMDTDIAAGYYHLLTHQQAGVNPADTDAAVWHEWGYWDGNEWFTGITQDVNSIIADVPTTEEIRIEMDANSTDFNTIIADTNELQTEWANGGRLDVILDAIKAITDILPALSTTVVSATDPNTFVIAAGLDANDVYCGMTIYVKDATDSHWESRLIVDWEVGRTVTVDSDFGFTPAASDVVYLWGQAYFPLRVFNGLPKRDIPDPVIIDNRVPAASGGGTMTLDINGLDP